MKSSPLVVLAGLALALAGCDKKPAGDGNVTAPAKPVAAIPAPAGQDWTEVAVATPEGGVRMGNPDAPVKLLEWGSLTCPHCAEFSEKATGDLRALVKSGRVSWEYRSFLLSPIDVPATILAKCQGPGPFFKLLEQVYAEQKNWIKGFENIPDAEQKRINALPPAQQVPAIAKIGHLDDFFRARGLPEAKANACLADTTAPDKLAAMRQAATDSGVDGTPSFFINGAKSDTAVDAQSLLATLHTALGG